MNSNFNSDKRRTLKILTGATACGLLASNQVFAELRGSQFTTRNILDSKLISRADLSRAHLLVHNRSNADVVISAFKSQVIRYDNSFLNMANAYMETVVIPANDKVMIRLSMEAGVERSVSESKVVDMNAVTQYLPQGTRVVDMKLRLNDGVAEIEKLFMLS